ncbi:hypothetical protein DF050_36700 [Burkholderia cepacia]|nr:hypothetical protein DF050_36700 [Burkholderia cepacia]
MPVVKHFTQAQWDAVARRLDALPPKPANEHHVTVRDAVNAMRLQISGAQQKGCKRIERAVLDLIGTRRHSGSHHFLSSGNHFGVREDIER